MRFSLFGMLLSCVAIGGAGFAPVSRAAQFSTVHAFTGKADGATPVGGVVVDAQGNMYGQATYGALQCFTTTQPTGCGTVFKIDPAGNVTVLVTFDGSNGELESAPLTLVGNRLYGAAETAAAPGDNYQLGLIFSVRTDGSDFKILHQFNGFDGLNPNGGLQVMGNGDIYGTTYGGGTDFTGGPYSYYGAGVLFRLKADGTYTVLHYFDPSAAANEAQPGGIVVAKNGTIYGATDSADLRGDTVGGSIYEYVPSSSVYQTLHFFKLKKDGGVPMIGGFLGDHTLFGATVYGPSTAATKFGYGTLFSLDQNGLTTLYSFTGGADGSVPNQPTRRPNGAIVGSTASGGVNNAGAIYSFKNGLLITLHSFSATELAPVTPAGPIAFTPSGNIVGTTESTEVTDAQQCTLADGQAISYIVGCGAVFSLAP